MDKMNGKQSEAVDGLIISAVSDHNLTKPREILKFLHGNRHARNLTSSALNSRLHRLRKLDLVSRSTAHRTAEEMGAWRANIAAIVNGQSRQLGVRGVFYLAVAAGLCEKTDSKYQAVVDALDILRMSGEVAFDRIIDAGRTIHPHGLDARSPVVDLMTNATDYDEIRSHIDSAVTEEADEEPSILWPTSPDFDQAREPEVLAYALMGSYEVQADIDHGTWDGCDAVPFVICEKEGLSGIIQPICSRYDVPFVAVRGAASITILHDIWELLETGDLPWRVLTLYDLDEAGENIERGALNRLRAFGGEAEWTSERIAVTHDQVDELLLPMRPEKNGDGEAVELDAIPPDTLAEIVTEAIKACIPEDIEDQRGAARSDAREAHNNTVEAMVNESMEDYEPQRNEEMQRYVEEAQPRFNDLRAAFLRDAPE